MLQARRTTPFLLAFVLLSGPLAALAQPSFSQVQKVTASTGRQSDFFGDDVAVDGDTAVVGARFYDDDQNEQGAAFVYERDPATGSWGEVRRLVASDLGFDNFFGDSVAIDGDTIVVGAPGNDVAFDVDQGSAYVFERNAGGAGQWGQVREIFCPVAAECATDLTPVGAFGVVFGSAVAIDGDRIAVGAPGSDLSDDDGGAAYVFERNLGGANQWGTVRTLTSSGGGTGSSLGASIDLAGDTLVAGRPDPGGGSGDAVVFERNLGGGDNWGEAKRLQASSPSRRFGSAVAVRGDTLVVGAPTEEVGANFDQGAAYVFRRDLGGAGNWGEARRLLASGPSVLFGGDVDVQGTTAVVGAAGNLFADDPYPGFVYVFGRDLGGAEQWGEAARLAAADGAHLDRFGSSVALAGSNLVIGADSDDIGAGLNVDRGSAYVFGSFRPPLDALSVGASDLVTVELAVFPAAAGKPALSARVNGADSASANGVALSSPTVDATGAVSASVAVACDAGDASFAIDVFSNGELVAGDTLTVEVGQSAAPVLGLRRSFNLWPASHLHWPVPVFALVENATDDCDGDVTHDVVIEQVTSDEPDDAPGLLDGLTRHDIVAPFCELAFIRAERNQAGNGRVYGITLRVRDSEGNETREVFRIGVPIKLRGTAVENAPAQAIATGCP